MRDSCGHGRALSQLHATRPTSSRHVARDRKIGLAVGFGGKPARMPPSRGQIRLPPEDLALITGWDAAFDAAK